LGTELCGYGYYLGRKAEGILDDLKARVLFLQEKERKLILVSCDITSFSTELADALRREISAEENVPFENILIAATHTHTAPAGQRMRGCGEISFEYLGQLREKIKEAVRAAIGKQEEAEAFYSFKIIEPIGFNRRRGNFEPIDPLLKLIIFKGKDRTLYLVSYACHPVILRRINKVSPDWPGALVREMEKDGNCGIFFQGFCGDINPVAVLNGREQGRMEDVSFYGRLLYEGVLKAEEDAHKISNPALTAVERRIKLPLKVLSREEIEREKRAWVERAESRGEEGAKRFIEDWGEEALGKYEEFLANPYLENVPIQIIGIGELKIVCLPGEVFCEYDLKLRKEAPNILTIGYANGMVGYIPTRSAFEEENDYACYEAAKIYDTFPFSPEIEEILLGEIRELLNFVESHGE